MDKETAVKVEDLLIRIRNLTTGDIALMDAISDALQLAIGTRDWSVVVQVSATVQRTALELASIYGRSA